MPVASAYFCIPIQGHTATVYAIVDSLFSTEARRISQKIGQIRPSEMEAIDRALAQVFGLKIM
jgi:mRNA-degrading endonuclease toxin of MazEF toxin-antitoxin module